MREPLPPEWRIYYAAAAAIFGLLIGSFLNVCIYRVPRDLSIVFPRSFCPECGTPIAWYDNVPLLSFLLLGGRCRKCRNTIGLRYPAVEFTTGILLASVAVVYGWSGAALKWAVFECIAVVLFWTDIEERILPDELTLGGLVLGLVFAFFVPVHGILDFLAFRVPLPWRSVLAALLGALVLSIPMWALGFTYELVRKREGLGFGDVKLLALIGSFLGVENGIFAMMIGAVSGAILGLAYIIIWRRKASEYHLPFGSFLCVGAAILPLLKTS